MRRDRSHTAPWRFLGLGMCRMAKDGGSEKRKQGLATAIHQPSGAEEESSGAEEQDGGDGVNL